MTGFRMSQRYDFGDGKLVPVRIHENGGGVVALTAHVDPACHVGVGCEVSGGAKIYGKAKISGRVKIIGSNLPGEVSVQIEDEAIVSGRDIVISGTVLIRDRAQVRGSVKISGAVQVMHRARVDGEGIVLEGDVKVLEGAYITGKTRIVSHGRRTIIRGEQYMKDVKVEHIVRNENQRKPRVTAVRPAIYEALAA